MGKFFFDDDASKSQPAVKKDAKFDALKDAGLIGDEETPTFFEAVKRAENTKDKSGTATLEVQASMKKLKTQYLEIEYGVYKDNYAIHITPVHEKKNIANDRQVQEVLKCSILAINEVVPYQLQVEIHPPKPAWKMKVISFVIVGGAKAWNLQLDDLETKTVPKMFAEIQIIILKG